MARQFLIHDYDVMIVAENEEIHRAAESLNDLDQAIRLIDLNAVSTVALAKSVATGMVERGRGRILFTSSVIARTPAPIQVVYGASKAFVQSFGQALRNEHRILSGQPAP